MAAITEKKKMTKKTKIIIAIVVVLVAVIGILAYVQRQKFYENNTESRLTNPPRNTEAYTDTFYYDQLTDKEKGAYDVLKETMDSYMGGEVTFPEPLNGTEFTRVYMALEYGEGDYFYTVVGIPLTSDNVNLSVDNSDMTAVTEDIVAKSLLLAYGTEGINEIGQMDEEGHVTNLDEINKLLTTENKERQTRVLELQEETERILGQIVADMPEDYNTKDAIDYFLKWIDENLSYTDAAAQSEGIDSMSGLFEKMYFTNHRTCVVEKTAIVSGYSRVLSDLCNRAGIASHVVMGTWTSFPFGTAQDSYMLTCVEIDGENIYVDAAGRHGKELLDQRYIGQDGAEKWMPFLSLFSY